jgi:hypothetical protein
MTQKSEYVSLEVPGVGEFKAREGTSTVELAGAIHYWHKKAKTAYIDGAVGGSVLTLLFTLCCYGVYYLLR